MGVKRSHNGQHVSIPTAIFGLGLSPHAITLIVYALSQAEWFVFSERSLLDNLPLGRTTLHKAIDELREVGLVHGSFRSGLTFFDESADNPATVMAAGADSISLPVDPIICSRNEQDERGFVRDANKCDRSLFARRTRPPISRTNPKEEFVRETDISTNSLFNKNKTTKQQQLFFPEVSGPYRAEDVRELCDFDTDATVQLRKRVARTLWCPNLRADVIDRATAAIVMFLPGASLEAYRELRTEAGYRETPTKPVWAIVNLGVAKLFDAVGWAYGPTRIGDEPRPAPTVRQPDPDEDARAVEAEAIMFAELAGVARDDPFETIVSKLASTDLTPVARPAFAKRILRLYAQGVTADGASD